ncbi:hypothetical protein CEXT_314391 [Caerostris extrusa]|uniref:Uncharacterized protein n=1 Tax=Caerostris extrusa TaxID=172846 RepID=A0AAV4RHS3_CAEEX|nr:hypothetical protein CEXT_314391 [Caerostris extrusa]
MPLPLPHTVDEYQRRLCFRRKLLSRKCSNAIGECRPGLFRTGNVRMPSPLPHTVDEYQPSFVSGENCLAGKVRMPLVNVDQVYFEREMFECHCRYRILLTNINQVLFQVKIA